MKKYLLSAVLIALLSALTSETLLSQTAQDILEKMINAQGGREALEKIKDTTTHATIEMMQMGMTGTVTMYQKEPNKLRMDTEMMGMIMTQAFDGQTAWMDSPQTGVQIMSEKLGAEFKQQALGNDSLLHPEKYGITYQYKGEAKEDDRDCHVLEVAYLEGREVTMFLDPSTYLPYKMKTTSLDQAGMEADIENILSDYKKVGEVIVPFSILVKQDGIEAVRIILIEVEHNKGLEDSLFEMPGK